MAPPDENADGTGDQTEQENVITESEASITPPEENEDGSGDEDK